MRPPPTNPGLVHTLWSGLSSSFRGKGGGGDIGGMLVAGDVHVCVPHKNTARIQEVHLLTLHCLCDGIDCLLLGPE